MEEQQRRRELISEMQQLGEVASTETALFHQAAAATYGLGITDMKTLSALLQEGSMTAGQLTQRLNLTTGAITNVIDRLERRGAARRAPDPNDRRKVIVTPNLEVIHGSGNVYLSMGAAFEELLEAYSTEELLFLVKYYRAMIEMTRREIAKLKAT